MSLSTVKNRMEEMGFHGMLEILEGALTRVTKGEMSTIEAIDELLETEWRFRKQKATHGRVSRSKIRPGVSLEEFDFTLSRGVTKAQLRDLSKLDWCDEGKPLIFIGPTGVGKSFIARSLGLLACEKGKTVLFLSFTDFIEHQAMARSSSSYLKFRERLVRPDVLILDDLGMRKFSSQEAEDLRDIIEQRSYGKSTVITTQLPVDHWGEVFGDQIILDALVDRLDPPGIKIEFGEKTESYRGKKKMETKRPKE
jgi:DNA replication protein DnaC